MKTPTLLLVGLCASCAYAQTAINKTVPVLAGQQVRLHFDYPKIIRLSTWDKNEIAITGSVSINGGENDDAFELITDFGEGVLSIQNRIKNMDGLPKRITVIRDGVRTTFRNKGEWETFKKENGKGSYQSMNQGVDMEIELEIKVPANVQTFLVAVYGMVEITSFKGPLDVEATYGGVDVSLTESTTGELIAETNYGHIYSDLTIKFDSDKFRDEDFHMYVSAKPGVGPRYRLESPYGNVYLRRGR